MSNTKDQNSKVLIIVAIIGGAFAVIAALIGAISQMISDGVIDPPFIKSKIEPELIASMTELKTGLEELDAALDLEGKSIEEGIVYCRKTHPANILHGFETILNANSYDTAGEPAYIKRTYAGYQAALQTVKSKNLQTVYNACLIFDRTGSGDPELTQEEFDTANTNAQADVTQALETLNKAIEEMP